MPDQRGKPIIESTRKTRDLPILAAALRRLDAGEDGPDLCEVFPEVDSVRW